MNFAKCKCPLHFTTEKHSGYIYCNFSSVVEYPRWWVLKSKIFGQNKHTQSKMFSAVFCEYNECQCQLVNRGLKKLNLRNFPITYPA